MPMGTTECPYCGETFNNNLFRRHIEFCRKLPDKNTLIELSNTITISQLAYELGVDQGSLRQHYQRLGIYDFKIRNKHMTRDLPPLAGHDFAPRFGGRALGTNTDCVSCVDYAECKGRQANNLWPLCCLPTRVEVALAFRDGKIGFDHNMPEWLPELVETIKIQEVK